MDELERELRDIATRIDYPARSDLASKAIARMSRSDLTRQRHRRGLAISFVAALAVAATLAATPAGMAILRLLHLEGVEVELLDRLPSAGLRATPPGMRMSLAQARKSVDFSIVLPEGYDLPDAVYVSSYTPGGYLTLEWRSHGTPRLLLGEFIGRSPGPEVLKSFPRQAPVDRVRVNGKPGIWLGAKHAFRFVDAAKVTRSGTSFLAGKTLIWERGDLLLRLEVNVSEQQALDIARSIR